jgi:hypothetical protein
MNVPFVFPRKLLLEDCFGPDFLRKLPHCSAWKSAEIASSQNEKARFVERAPHFSHCAVGINIAFFDAVQPHVAAIGFGDRKSSE